MKASLSCFRRGALLFGVAIFVVGGCGQLPAPEESSTESQRTVVPGATVESATQDVYEGVTEATMSTQESPALQGEEFAAATMREAASGDATRPSAETFALAVVQGVWDVRWSEDLRASLQPFVSESMTSNQITGIVNEYDQIRDARLNRHVLMDHGIWFRSAAPQSGREVQSLHLEAVMLIDGAMEGKPFWAKTTVNIKRSRDGWTLVGLHAGPLAFYEDRGLDLALDAWFLEGDGWRHLPPSSR